jgi:hyperosmotically inducible protein
VERAGDRTGERTERNGERAERATGEARQEISDTWITTKVKANFWGEQVLRGSDISVDTDDNGVVTLTGKVPNERAKDRARDIARGVDGVRKVNDDNLRVERQGR